MNRSFVASTVASIAVVIVYLLIPSMPITPHGIFLAVAPLETPITPNEVNFYNSATIPCVYKKIGYINVQFYSKKTTYKEETQLQQYVRKIAAKAGANGVIVTFFGHTISGLVQGALSSYVFKGIAIYVVPSISI